MDYKIISADCHVDLGFLPWDLFTSRAPSQWKERMPHVIDRDGSVQWWADDVKLENVGLYGDIGKFNPGMKLRIDRMARVGFLEDSANGNYHPTNMELRIKDQELDGVDAEVIYGLIFVDSNLKDRQQVETIYRIFNDWLAEFCNKNPGRFAGLACLPNHDPEAAAEELRRAAKMGLRGAELVVSTAVRPIYYRDWDVLWAASAECGLPISFHSTGLNPTQRFAPEDREMYRLTHRTIQMTIFQLGGAEFLASIILGGACERFPDFKFVLGECGVTWIPYVLDRMDHENEGDSSLSMKPSDYWHRQGHSTFQKEGFSGDMVDFIGEDNLMWGSDYPHPDGVWPDSQETIAYNLRNLKDQDRRRKIVCENAAKLYGFQLN